MGEFVIYETDERMFFLKRQLAGLRPLVNTHVFAPNLLLSAERFDHIRDGETLIAGRLDDGAEKLAEQKGLRVCRILADEAFRRKTPASPPKERWASSSSTVCCLLRICACSS